MIIIIMRGENFVAHLDGLGGTPVCRGTPVAHHCSKTKFKLKLETFNFNTVIRYSSNGIRAIKTVAVFRIIPAI
jgi:hypothetical protein